MATQAQINDFFKTIGPVAVKVCKELGYNNPSLWTCICQAACESGYGTSSLMKKANAFFGIKATSSWNGRVYNSKTSECYDGKTYTNINACFRAYNSLEDSIRDYFKLISGSRYNASLNCSSVKECITVIKNGGYALSPTYIQTICNIYESYRGSIECYTVDCKSENNTQLKSIDEIANEVIRGDWGNGSERKSKLESAGYNYSEVQSKVNELCSGVASSKPSLKSIDEVAREVIRGDWGNGQTRKDKLQAAGYNYSEVQSKVNELLR